jgi:hypothetical protein
MTDYKKVNLKGLCHEINTFLKAYSIKCNLKEADKKLIIVLGLVKSF